MEERDLELIAKHRSDNYDLDRLYREHLEFEIKIAKMENITVLSDNEQLDLHNLKKLKLDGRDKIESILSGYR